MARDRHRAIHNYLHYNNRRDFQESTAIVERSDTPCFDCNRDFLTKPRVCLGRYSPENRGRIYQAVSYT